MAAQLVGESTAVLRLPVRSVSYRVPGRKRDGTEVSGPAGRFLRAVLMVPYALVAFPVVVVLGFLADWGIDLTSADQRKITVQGKGSSCQALPFADVLRGAKPGVWLAWSRSQVALVSSDDEHGPRVLWRGSGPQRPKLQAAKANIRWPDGSRVDFVLPREERARLQEKNGTP